MFNYIKQKFQKGTNRLSDAIDGIFSGKKLDEDQIAELENLLLSLDMGVDVTMRIIEVLRRDKYDKSVTSIEIKEALAGVIEKTLSIRDHSFVLSDKRKPSIILLCGVNGSGKTTTIGKMVYKYTQEGKSVGVAACDTFRAAAVGQIEEWVNRSGPNATLYKGKVGDDPAMVAYKAIKQAQEEEKDILLIDTAGRLHNNEQLMEELGKIIRVIRKLDPDGVEHSLLVLDGTSGQNLLQQAEVFKRMAHVSGVIFTKLDSSSRVGTLVSVISRYDVGVRFVGVGENIEDLREFDIKRFSKAIVGIKNSDYETSDEKKKIDL